MIDRFAVARRSPRFRTPSRYFTAITVVPWVSKIADCGLRIADWSDRDPPNPQSAIRNPQSPRPTSSSKLPAGRQSEMGLLTAALPVAAGLVGVDAAHAPQQVAGVGAADVGG